MLSKIPYHLYYSVQKSVRQYFFQVFIIFKQCYNKPAVNVQIIIQKLLQLFKICTNKEKKRIRCD